MQQSASFPAGMGSRKWIAAFLSKHRDDEDGYNHASHNAGSSNEAKYFEIFKKTKDELRVQQDTLVHTSARLTVVPLEDQSSAQNKEVKSSWATIFDTKSGNKLHKRAKSAPVNGHFAHRLEPIDEASEESDGRTSQGARANKRPTGSDCQDDDQNDNPEDTTVIVIPQGLEDVAEDDEGNASFNNDRRTSIDMFNGAAVGQLTGETRIECSGALVSEESNDEPENVSEEERSTQSTRPKKKRFFSSSSFKAFFSKAFGMGEDSLQQEMPEHALRHKTRFPSVWILNRTDKKTSTPSVQQPTTQTTLGSSLNCQHSTASQGTIWPFFRSSSNSAKSNATVANYRPLILTLPPAEEALDRLILNVSDVQDEFEKTVITTKSPTTPKHPNGHIDPLDMAGPPEFDQSMDDITPTCAKRQSITLESEIDHVSVAGELVYKKTRPTNKQMFPETRQDESYMSNEEEIPLGSGLSPTTNHLMPEGARFSDPTNKDEKMEQARNPYQPPLVYKISDRNPKAYARHVAALERTRRRDLGQGSVEVVAGDYETEELSQNHQDLAESTAEVDSITASEHAPEPERGTELVAEAELVIQADHIIEVGADSRIEAAPEAASITEAEPLAQAHSENLHDDSQASQYSDHQHLIELYELSNLSRDHFERNGYSPTDSFELEEFYTHELWAAENSDKDVQLEELETGESQTVVKDEPSTHPANIYTYKAGVQGWVSELLELNNRGALQNDEMSMRKLDKLTEDPYISDGEESILSELSSEPSHSEVYDTLRQGDGRIIHGHDARDLPDEFDKCHRLIRESNQYKERLINEARSVMKTTEQWATFGDRAEFIADACEQQEAARRAALHRKRKIYRYADRQFFLLQDMMNMEVRRGKDMRDMIRVLKERQHATGFDLIRAAQRLGYQGNRTLSDVMRFVHQKMTEEGLEQQYQEHVCAKENDMESATPEPEFMSAPMTKCPRGRGREEKAIEPEDPDLAECF
ncbi:hypothetical protein F66182_3993 [Fusarium sp. NRRL 66182]|nr:hypothetical protein F66182_3993 [Fusarium sp. NRRL 66182]